MKPSFPYDERLADEAKLMVPERDGKPVLDTPFIDAMAWPRDLLAKGEPSEKKMAEAERKGLVVTDLPASARTSWGTIYKRTVLPGKPGLRSVREEIERALQGRTLIVYFAGSADAPVRMMLHPVISKQECGDIFRSAGLDSSLTGLKLMFSSISLFTRTSKMGCFSFNLPAGPPELHGTCPSSTLAFATYTPRKMLSRYDRRTDRQLLDPAAFICNGCYALKGQYGVESSIVTMQVRYALVRALLGMSSPVKVLMLNPVLSKEVLRGRSIEEASKYVLKQRLGEKPKSFADVIVDALDWTIVKLDAARGRREKKEPFRHSERDYRRAEKLLQPKKKGAEPVEGEPERVVLQRYAWQLPDPRYFRIHDAGDFWSPKYLDQWLEVCRRQPDIQFWAPTRVWAVKSMLPPEVLRRIPDNMTVRPSSLHFRQPPPTGWKIHAVKLPRVARGSRGGGLAAGSGSTFGTRLPAHSWPCPAYLHYSVGGGALFRKDVESPEGYGGTCSLARGPRGEDGCRACWDDPSMEVYYHEH